MNIADMILNSDQVALFLAWKAKHGEPIFNGDLTLRYKWIIVPTSVGNEITVVDLKTGEELDLSMAETW